MLSIAAIIARSAVESGLRARQSEVHGMAQRGGAVLAHLRMADRDIPSDLVPQGGADLIIAMEPLESLRYAAWLSPSGVLVSAAEPLINIPDYPAQEKIDAAIRRFPVFRLIPALELAQAAGNRRSVNMVMVGAAAPFLPIKAEGLEKTITNLFAARYPELAAVNLRAFRLGQQAAASQAA